MSNVAMQAKAVLASSSDLTHEYLPIAGLEDYLTASQRLVLGNESIALQQKRIVSAQTLSGTGALHLGALFLSRFFPASPAKTVYVSSPPYVNHLPILKHVSLATGVYAYYSPATKGLDFAGLMESFSRMPDQSIILLHACAHNPTGVDPSRDQWKEIARVMKVKRQLPFFDSAYQGFATGDLDNDAWAIRHFVEQGFDTVMVAQSFAKNFGLYGERAGCLHVIAADADLASRIGSQLKLLQRVEISTPPAYGARIVSTILNDPELYERWKDDLRTMSNRILNRRGTLRRLLETNGNIGSWNHVTQQVGMFCYTGLTPRQVELMREKYHIYMTTNGRISISGLNTHNTEYVAEAFRAVIRAEGLSKL